MIFEFLDVKKKRIATYTDAQLLSGVVRRELVDRTIKDSMDVTFTLDMLGVAKESTYVLLSDVDWFRVNPIYKIADLSYSNTLKITGVSESLDRANTVTVSLEDGQSLLDAINIASVKIGYKIAVDTRLDEEQLTGRVLEFLDIYDEDGFELSDAVNVIAQVIGGTSEFDTEIVDDYVASTVLRITEDLGKEVKDALIYGVNISSINVDERNEGIITAVEYTGREVDDDGNENLLTLDWRDASVPRTYTLPNSKRQARLMRYVDADENVRFILEDIEATRTHGLYTTDADKEAEPIIATFSNTDIPTLDDLIDFAIKELDGKSVPQTQYQLSATVNGLDVGDNLGIQIPHLGINRFMRVLSVDYDMAGEYESNITVGDHLPTEIEKRFERLATLDDLGEDKEDLPVDTKRGETVADVIPSQTIQYAIGDDLQPHVNVRAHFVKSLNTNMYPHLYDYYLSFDYKINNGYSGGFFELGLTYQSSPTYTRFLRSNTFPTDYVGCVVNVGLEGQSGSVDVRMNDYTQFMRAYELSGISTRNRGEENFHIYEGNNVFPLVAVYDGTGTAYYLNYLGRDVYPATTKEELDMLPGYITNFKITQHKRTTRDRDGDYSMYKTSEVEQLTLALDFENDGKDLL